MASRGTYVFDNAGAQTGARFSALGALFDIASDPLPEAAFDLVHARLVWCICRNARMPCCGSFAR